MKRMSISFINPYPENVMQPQTLTYTAIFLISSAASAFLGISILTRQSNIVTRSFFAISACLCLWAFGFAIAVSAPTVEVCLFWRRICAVGWGMIFAIILRFILILTEYKRLYLKKWLTGLIYLPAAVTVYVFSLSDSLANVQYQFVLMPGGWVNVAVNNGYDIFFYAYLAVYCSVSLFLLWNWRKRSAGKNTAKQARMLLISFGLAVLLGTLTDLVNSSLLLLNIPQMAPIAFLIPLLGIYYSIRNYRFMNVTVDDDEKILTESSRGKIVTFMGIGFIVSGILYFVTQHLIEHMAKLPGFILSALLTLFGFFVLAVERNIVKIKSIDTMFVMTAIITIPIIATHFIGYGGITVWAFPFVFLILSVLFNSTNLLIGTAAATILSQTMSWSLAPRVQVYVSSSDYLTRLVIFGICIWIAFYVNQIYIRRLKENAERNQYQRLISSVSSSCVAISESNKDQTIERLLQELNACFKTDQAALGLFTAAMSPVNCCSYKSDGGSSFDIPTCYAGWDHAELEYLTSKDISIGNVEHVTDDMLLPIQSCLKIRKVKSFTSLPLKLADSVGFLSLEKAEACDWNADQLATLRVISNTITDALKKLSAEKEINFMAYHDYLTGLPNRILFSDRTEQAIQMAKRSGAQIAVIFLDLDSFKSINDTLGHRMGDELIKAVAEKLTDSIRSYDTVSRFGGDEFLIMLNGMSKRADIERVVDSLMSIFEEPFLLKGQEIFITASAGIAIYPFDGEDTDTLVKNADIAMYSAKDKGKNQYLFCSEDMKEDVQYKVMLTNYLYRALERNELHVYYQPQVSLQTNKIIGAEALLRWFHPAIGTIPPSVFIPLAEKTGIINSIGEWVLHEACRQIKHWQQKGLPPIRVAVNISVNQLRNPLFLGQVKDLLVKHNFEPQYLELEVTESIAIKEPAYIISVLEGIKKLGVFISIDDFGTEYSSLSRLKQLPVDRIKMDMQFVQGIDKNEKDRAISKVIINLAKSLGMKVIAEGVENDVQLNYLSQRLCDEVQGYVYYKPMPAEEFERILEQALSAEDLLKEGVIYGEGGSVDIT